MAINSYSISLYATPENSTSKSVRGCVGWGFFAEFLWVINYLHWCQETYQTPVIYWGEKSSYYSPNGYNGSQNAWEYYFEPVSDQKYNPGDLITTKNIYSNFSAIWMYYQYIENINLCSPQEKSSFHNVLNTPLHIDVSNAGPVGDKHLHDPEFRNYIKKAYLDRYIKIKTPIKNKIKNFYDSHIKGKKTIGIHLRGKFLWNEVNFVPTSTLLEYANKLADKDTQFYIATDQYPLIEEAKKILGNKVIYYDFKRAQSTTSPVAGGPKLHPIEGENLLIEMKLLSKCNHLVHTLSNVSTTALYFNPSLSHTVLY